MDNLRLIVLMTITASLLIVQAEGASLDKPQKGAAQLEKNLELIAPFGYKQDKRDYKWLETHYEDTDDNQKKPSGEEMRKVAIKRRLYNEDKKKGWIEEYKVYKVILPARAPVANQETPTLTTLATLPSTTPAPSTTKRPLKPWEITFEPDPVDDSEDPDKTHPKDVIKESGWIAFPYNPNWRPPPDSKEMRALLDEYRHKKKFSTNNHLGDSDVPKFDSHEKF